jgi:predicted Abi (CAAX) family protease
MLARVAPRLVSFEEQVAGVREALAALHERQEDWTAAAQTLAGIDLDSGRPARPPARTQPCLSTSAAAASWLQALRRTHAHEAL